MFRGKQDILMPNMYFIVSKCNSILCKNDKKKKKTCKKITICFKGLLNFFWNVFIFLYNNIILLLLNIWVGPGPIN